MLKEVQNRTAVEIDAALANAVRDTREAGPTNDYSFAVALSGHLDARGLVIVKRAEIDAAVTSLVAAFGEIQAWKAR
jgi:hypothetical protein